MFHVEQWPWLVAYVPRGTLAPNSPLDCPKTLPMERRLGRGLGSLLSETRRPPAPEEPQATGSQLTVDVGRIRPNPFQPRTHFDPEGLEELTRSIRNHGILQPIALREVDEGQYELIAGERRWRAAQAAGLEQIPATVRRDLSDHDMLELALVENLQRIDLHPIERAEGFRRMMVELKLTQEGVADKVGLKRSSVANHLRLLDLPGAVQAMVAEGLLTMGHARALLGAAGDDIRCGLAERVVRQGLSVRETERMVKDLSAEAPSSTKSAPPEKRVEPWANEMQDRIRERLGTRVRVQNGDDYRGQIVIEYFGREELDRVYSLLAPRETI